MTLTERLRELVRACYTGLWIESHEHDDAISEIGHFCQTEDWRLAVWDVEQGLQLPGIVVPGTPAPGLIAPGMPAATDPLAAIRALAGLTTDQQPTLLILVNFHRYLGSGEIVQALARQLALGKQQRTFVLILSALVNIPAELAKQFVIVPHELPSRRQLAEIAQSIASEEGEMPSGPEGERLLDAAVGLTRYEAEGAFSLSLVRHGRLQPEVLWQQKAQWLARSGLLTLHRGGETFADLGGLEGLKAFCLRALRRPLPTADAPTAPGSGHRPRVQPRGVLLLSPPGCGKSAFAKSLGNETGRPTLALDIGSLLGSLVGESERNLRQALKLVEAMAPCVLYADELEKGLAGASGGAGDSGVSARLFGHLLSWLNDRICDVFFVGTCNDISRLPPEFTRAERFDAVVFIDLPTAEQRQQIWQLYLAQFALDAAQQRPDDTQWTGAEIKACCRLAALLDLPLTAAAQNVVPIARTASSAIEQLRHWASGRCLAADRPGIFQATLPAETPRSRRRVSRDPSDN